MSRVLSAHVWGQSPDESEADDRARPSPALSASSELCVDMSRDCPPTRPEETP